MDTIWKIYGKKADFDGIAQEFHIDRTVARMIHNRDVCGSENIRKYLNGTVQDLYPPRLFFDSDRLVAILAEKIKGGCKIRIVGDYDTDGVCATVILYSTIKMLGGCVDYCIPHRILDGYGINERIVQSAIDEGIDTIITCDNGITAIGPMELACNRQITVLITDHHEPYMEEGREIIPKAAAVVNPHRAACEYPFKEICGAVVACKVMELLVEELDRGAGISQEQLDVWRHRIYELAAIATVGDVMPLVDENRIIVKHGLKLMQTSQLTGLRALARELSIDMQKIGAYHIGFQIAPCLNAGGRLETALMAIELLLEEDEEKAQKLAQDLCSLNQTRKELTEKWSEAAIHMAEEQKEKNKVLVLFLAGCHESIAGIVAGRVREVFYRPVFVITEGEYGLKGSGRSIEGYDMFDGLLKCKDLLEHFGGHVMAAGLSFNRDNLEELTKRLNEDCTLTEQQMTPVKWLDMEMPMDYVTEELVEQIKLLEPFGNGNTRPVFAQRGLQVCGISMAGAAKNVMRLTLADKNARRFSCVKFRCDGISLPKLGDVINCVYYPSVNEYNGKKYIQYVIEEIV